MPPDTSPEAMQARIDASTPIADYHCPDDLGAEVYAMLARSLDESRAARARRKLAAMDAAKTLPRKGNRAPRKTSAGAGDSRAS